MRNAPRRSETSDVFGLASRYKFEDLALHITALHAYNQFAVPHVRPERLIQLLVDRAGTHGTLRPSVAVSRSLIESVENAYVEGELKRRSAPADQVRGKDPSSTRVIDSLPELETMMDSAWMIMNPGTVGQLLGYALDRYRAHTDLLRQYLGLTAEEVCRTTRVIQMRQEDLMRSELAKRFSAIGNFQKKRYQKRLDTPPNSFLTAWEQAVTLGPPDLPVLVRFGLAPAAVTFLTASPEEFSAHRQSFSRWAFIPRAGNRVQLLAPFTLAETAASSIHLALLEKLPESAMGQYGLSLGKVFERLVEGQFARHYPAVQIERRRRFSGQKGDTDLLVKIDGDSWILVQCKGRILRPEGRWGRRDHFVADLERNIVGAAEQAREALLRLPAGWRVEAVFVVLDAYFAGATMFTFSGGHLTEALADLPNPVVLAYYDLEYLLEKIGLPELRAYLTWREEMLRTKRILVQDELDLIRLYGRRQEGVIDVVREKEGNLFFVGEDDEFDRQSTRELDLRLFSGNPNVRIE
jgi:hypothetical protein